MILTGDSLKKLRTLPSESVQMCVTSPPYFGLRDYGVPGQIGLEPTPEEFTARLVDVFREVRRVLANDGVLWLNLGDSYAATVSNNGGYSAKSTLSGFTAPDTKGRIANESGERRRIKSGCKPKDLIGIPWMVAFALRADGWYLRSDIIWHKPNPMPESVTDRPTKSHEYMFLLSKSERYFYDADAVREPFADERMGDPGCGSSATRMIATYGHVQSGKLKAMPHLASNGGRNRRTVWTVSTKPYKGAHFATFPPKLIEPCILAGSRPGDVVLDPFAGACTTGLVAQQHGRQFIGIELNPAYVQMGRARLAASRNVEQAEPRTKGRNAFTKKVA